MEFAEVVRRRRMVRNYDPDRPVPTDIVDRLLDHAVRAPSAGFSQGWGFLVLQTQADRDLYWSATTPEAATPEAVTPEAVTPQGPMRGDAPADRAWRGTWLERMRRAPLIIVALSNRAAYLDRYAEPDKGWTDRDEARWPVPYWHVDTGFAALLIHLTAVDEGLGSCFFGIPPERIPVFRAAFGVPDGFTPIGSLTVGYRAEDPRSPSLRRGRRRTDEVVHHGRWSSPSP